MKFTLKAVLIAIAVVIAVLLYGGLYTLEEGLQAIVVQFGRPVGEPVTVLEKQDDTQQTVLHQA